MKILMVCHTPWRVDLGAPRVQIELAEELRRLGHHVDHFAWDDAFPRGLPARTPAKLRMFSLRTARFLRVNGSQYDIVDAQQGNLIHAPSTLGLSARLVIRSVGLVHHYQAWQRTAIKPSMSLRGRLGYIRLQIDQVTDMRATERSFDSADRIIVCNADELATLSTTRWSQSTRLVPLALSFHNHRSLLAANPLRGRAADHVAFVGTWDARKGRDDFPAIVRRIWHSMPETRFSFLGTWAGEQQVRFDLGVGVDARVRVIPRYCPEQLPELLAGVTVGAFPSYIEGFGLSVIEQLSAGIPVVAYDVPGPRDILRSLPAPLLVPAGDKLALAGNVVQLLRARNQPAAVLRQACQETASKFTWRTLAHDTVRVYDECFQQATKHASEKA